MTTIFILEQFQNYGEDSKESFCIPLAGFPSY